ncbi:MAG: hypothetical protein M1823_004796 [Watsoniomyces obsoletus]|nr:MAG: hypothetical protein M1823_004796 [Watsoniomyces obsoletus]
MKCDTKSPMCENCRSSASECLVLDRNSGESFPRNHLQHLETDRATLQNAVGRYQAALSGLGLDHTDAVPSSELQLISLSTSTPTPTGGVTMTNTNGPDPASGGDHLVPNTVNYTESKLGPSNVETWPATQGTQMRLLGVNVNLMDYLPAELYPEPIGFSVGYHGVPIVRNYTLASAMQSVGQWHGTAHVPNLLQVNWEGHQEAAEWYLEHIHPYNPVLHGNQLFELVNPIYQHIVPSTDAEQVILYMVYALWAFDFARRNPHDLRAQQLQITSTEYFHYSLHLWTKLDLSSELASFQARALITIYIQTATLPATAWSFTSRLLERAKMAGLHRLEFLPGHNKPITGDPLTIDLHRRVFWTILANAVDLSRCVGVPLSIRPNDIATEFPSTDAHYQTTMPGDDQPNGRQYSHLVAIDRFTLVPLWMDLLSSFYAVRRNPDHDYYREAVKSFERRLQAWRAQRVSVESQGSVVNDASPIYRHYLDLWEFDFRMAVAHPAVAMSNDGGFLRQNLRTCVRAGNIFHKTWNSLLHRGELNMAWYQILNLISSAATYTYAHWFLSRTENTIGPLKVKVKGFTEIFGSIGALNGK